jgi:hypothetical protein
MQLKLSDEQRDALAHAGPARVVEVIDPENRVSYVLIRSDVFERVRHLFETEDFDIREAYPLMDGAARAAGWDHPAEDIYDDLDPRREK